MEPLPEQPVLTEGDKPLNGDRLRYIKALDETKYSGTGRWNITAAASKLDIPRKTFAYRLRKMRMIG